MKPDLHLPMSGLVAATIFLAGLAHAQSPTFMNGVAFALTGSDGITVRVVDRANCVFMINAKTEGGRMVGDVFHLNNVQIDRISIQPRQNIVASGCKSSYEEHRQSTNTPARTTSIRRTR